jgi:hypothetical protein
MEVNMGNLARIHPIDSVREEAINILSKEFGIAKTAIFLRESMSGKSDYLKTKKIINAGKSARSIYNEIKLTKKSS